MNKGFVFVLISVIVLSSVGVLFGALPLFAHEGELSVVRMEQEAGATHHLEVKPESKEGYRIPYMKVTATLVDQEVGQERTVEFHPMFGGNFHYGANVALQPKSYVVRFHLDPPTFVRSHAREDQWLSPLEAEFPFDAAKPFEKNVKIGTRETEDMKVSFEVEHAEEMFILPGTEKEHAAQGETAPAQMHMQGGTTSTVAQTTTGARDAGTNTLAILVAALVGVGLGVLLGKVAGKTKVHKEEPPPPS